MLVSRIYQLVLAESQLKMTKVEIWVNWNLTDITDTQPIFDQYNWYIL